MKRQACLTTSFAAAALLLVSGASAARAADGLGELLTKIDAVRETPVQENYSRELQKSVNSAAVAAVAQACAPQARGATVRTFSMLGMIRIDGVLNDPTPIPDNAYTQCVANNISATHFPLPPGEGRGWPVAIQFDAKTGKAQYVAGDKQPTVPRYASTLHWVHTPLPPVPSGSIKKCAASVWLSIAPDGRVKSAEAGDSDCPAVFMTTALDATRQWIGFDKQAKSSDDATDLRVNFTVYPAGIRVTF